MNNLYLDNIEEHLRLQNYFYYLAFMECDIKKEIENNKLKENKNGQFKININ